MKLFIVMAVLGTMMLNTAPIRAQSSYGEDINKKEMSGFIYTNLRDVYDKTPEKRLAMQQDLAAALRGARSNIFRDNLDHFRQGQIINRIRENLSVRKYGRGNQDVMSSEEAAQLVSTGKPELVNVDFWDKIVSFQQEDGSTINLNYRVEAIRWPGQTRQPFIKPLEGRWLLMVEINGKKEPILSYSCGNNVILTVADEREITVRRPTQTMVFEGDEPDPAFQQRRGGMPNAVANNYTSITFPAASYTPQQAAQSQAPTIIYMMQPAAPQAVQTVVRESDPGPRRKSYEEEMYDAQMRQMQIDAMHQQQYAYAEMIRLQKRANTAQWVGNFINAAGHTINAFQNGAIIRGINNLGTQSTTVYDRPYYNRDPGYYQNPGYYQQENPALNPHHYSNFSIPWNGGVNNGGGNFQGGSVIPGMGVSTGTGGYDNGWVNNTGGYQPISWNSGASGYTVPVGNPNGANPYVGPGYTTSLINGGSLYLNDWRYRPQIGQ